MRKLEKPTFGDAQKGAAITVKVSPRAKHTEFDEVMDDGTLKIRVTAAPEDGAANAALIEFLAEAFDIPANQIEIVVGLSSEKKLVSLIGISPTQVEDIVEAWKAEAEAPAAKKKAPKKKK